jgi:UDP-N-acetylmuramyl pentapeptide phosphotransferase/UDP-N-acetylglucosamine-1-phosphate transferase
MRTVVNIPQSMLAAGFLAALLASFAVCWGMLLSRRAHAKLSIDDTIPGLHKVHRTPVPRIGGFGILAGVVAGAATLELAEAGWMFLFLLASLPAFTGGFLEDLTRKVSPYSRLLFAFGAAATAYLLVDARITDLDLPYDDYLFRYEILAFGLTLFAVGGFAHATNIIDGMNGLAGFVACAILAAIALVAWQVGDERVLAGALIVMGATLGFLVWNFPRGVIFAGDGGAYFLGFVIATLAVLLVHRNSEVSPWFALLALWYPVWETIYSMIRRGARGRSPADPDGMHLHTLVYRRIVKLRARPVARSAVTTLCMLALNVFTVVPAALFWDETWILQAYAAGFVLLYLWIYLRIARFGLPLGQILGRKARKAGPRRLARHPGRTL